MLGRTRHEVAAGADAGGALLRVMQWNTLADSLCSNASFPHVPDGERVLSWSHRAPLLSRELSRFGANVVCLEEVDETHFSELHAALGPGFAGSFAKKHNEGRDGVALLFDTASLQEEHSTCVRLGESEAQVALMKVLRHNESGKRALVACTHLKAKEGFEAVRLAQVEALLKHVAEFQRKCGCEDAAVVIAGDFNDVRTSPACRAMETAGFLSVYGAYHPRQPFFTTFKKRDVEVCRNRLHFLRPQETLSPRDLGLAHSRAASQSSPFGFLSFRSPQSHL